MPDLQVTALVVEHSLAPKLHAEDKEAEQLRQTTAEHIETQVEFKAVTQIDERILPKCTILMHSDHLTIHIPQSGMIDSRACQQAIQLYGLDGQQTDDAPDRL